MAYEVAAELLVYLFSPPLPDPPPRGEGGKRMAGLRNGLSDNPRGD